MKSEYWRRLNALATAAAVIPVLWACDSSGPASPEAALSPSFAVSTPPTQNNLVVCKFGSSATIQVSINGGAAVSHNLTDGECKLIDNYLPVQGQPLYRFATVTEVPQPGVVQLNSIRLDSIVGQALGTRTVTGSNSISTNYGLEVGATITFNNEVVGADIDLTKTAGSGTVDAGDPISFTMTVSSTGAGTATDVTLNDPLPGGNGISWSITTQPAGDPCTITGSAPNQTLSCDFGDLASGASSSVTVGSPTTTESCGVYNNTATASSTNGGSDEASASVTVECPPPEVFAGCTPGFWKNPKHFVYWTAPYTPTTLISAVFNTGGNTTDKDGLLIGDLTLLAGLSLEGGDSLGGAVGILMRAAIAAVLNAASPNVNYPQSVSDIVTAVNNAIASGDRQTILGLAGTLDRDNNLGCTAKD